MINFFVWLIAGVVLGWLATLIIHDRRRWSLLINITVGIFGAVVAGYLVMPMFNDSTFKQENFSIPALLLSLGGAVGLLCVVYLFRRKRIVSDDVLEAKWARVRGKIHVRWGKLTEEDIDQIDGKHDEFIRLLQVRYGCDKGKAEDDLQDYLRAVV